VHDLFSHVHSSFDRFTFSSALDILIVTVLFYSVLMLVRVTMADQVLRGVILLFIFFSLVAAAFQLTMVNWLLHNSPLVLLVAIPIIFQPELRRALEQVGRTSAIINHPIATLSTPMSTSSCDELVKAVRRLAERHYGALIVLEGTTGLEDFVRSGVRVDGDVTSDLLVTIFFLHSPLHDGAVIVQKDRIAAAACFLPLSMNPVLSTQLGTRHRAAIGITEETDAIAVVISEESGAISLASAGNIERELSVEELRRRLSQLLRRYVPATTLPTPISDGAQVNDAVPIPRSTLSRSTDSGMTSGTDR